MSTMRAAISKNGVPIRLTHKQWAHIVDSHDYMAGNMDMVMESIENPDYIVRGWTDELIALKHYERTSTSEKYMVVVYKDGEDGSYNNGIYDIKARWSRTWVTEKRKHATKLLFVAKMDLLHEIMAIILVTFTHDQRDKAEVKEELFGVVPHLLKMPSNRIWVDYDEDADSPVHQLVQKPQHADESEMEDNLIYHHQGEDLVGIIVTGAKKYGVKDEASPGSGIALA